MGNELNTTVVSSKIERRAFNTVFQRAAEGEGRMIEGYAAVFNSATEIGGWFEEVIEEGAFDEAINRSDCRALFNHNEDNLLARQSSGTLKLSIDSTGLKYMFESPNTTLGNDILVMIERGDLRESSFAFTVKEEEWIQEKSENGDLTYRRVIKKVDILYDVSPVTYPAYADTSVAKRSLEAWKAEHPPVTDEEEEEFFKETGVQGFNPEALALIFKG